MFDLLHRQLRMGLCMGDSRGWAVEFYHCNAISIHFHTPTNWEIAGSSVGSVFKLLVLLSLFPVPSLLETAKYKDKSSNKGDTTTKCTRKDW